MASAAGSKKRKRGAADDGVSVKASTLPDAQVGPVLVAFPAVRAPAATAFDVFLTGPDAPRFVDAPAIVQGEAPTVDFRTALAVNRHATGSTYYIALHNKRTGRTTLRPAPLHVLAREPKALKGIPPAAVSAADRLAARGALGAAFGTKKAQAAQRAQERNRIAPGAMRGVLGALQDRVAANTSALPSKEEAVAQADAARPIPPHDPAATDPAGAYPLAGIVPPPEWAALPAAALVAAGDAKARAALLPHTRSDYVWAHLRTVFAAPKPKTEDVRTLVYISYLLAFRGLARTLDSADAVRARLRGVPAPVLDGLLARFAEAARGSTAMQKTGATETKLLTHLFALCLRLDDYAVDTAVLAKDLSMTAPAVNALFKTLGCSIERLGPAELKRLGLPDSAGAGKRAVLRVPLVFPKPRAKRKTAGR